MPKIKIRDFGPIKKGYEENNGFLDISRVTLFIGNQGSGKSTICKLISTFLWMEKALVRGDYSIDDFSSKNFINECLAYHRLSDEYYNSKSELVYGGDAYRIEYKNAKIQIEKQNSSNYLLPQIIYIPAERSIVSSVGNAAKLKNISGALNDFITEYGNAKEIIRKSIELPLMNIFVEYDKTSDMIFIKGKDYRIKLTDAASGFHSIVPLYLVSRYLCDSIKSIKNGESMSSDEKRRFEKELEEITNDANLNEEQKRIARSKLGKKYNKEAFINIVEEPELNLFPSAQRQFLHNLLILNNSIRENHEKPNNKIIMTTHSPYLINFLSIAIFGKSLLEKIEKSCNNKSLIDKIKKIIPIEALITGDEVSIYQLHEANGSITKLSMQEGIPSDNNFLNNFMQQGNVDFDKLLEIEELL